MPMTDVKPCEGPECDRAAAAKGLCRAHYNQRRSGKPLTPVKERGDLPTCRGPECDRKARAKGLCETHYAQKLQGKPLTKIKARLGGESGPKLAKLPLLERIDRSTKREKDTGCLVWIRATNAAGSGVLNVNGHTTVISNLAYDLFHGVDIGSRRVLRACKNPACIEPAHMYARDFSDDWKSLEEPFYTAEVVADVAQKKKWRLVRYMNGTQVSRTSPLPKGEAEAAKRLFFGRIDEQAPTEAEWEVWLKYLTFARMGTKSSVAVHPLS